MSERQSPDEGRSEDHTEQRWRRLGVIGTWLDVCARVVELLARTR